MPPFKGIKQVDYGSFIEEFRRGGRGAAAHPSHQAESTSDVPAVAEAPAERNE